MSLLAGNGPDERKELMLFTDNEEIFFTVFGDVVGFDEAFVDIKNARRRFAWPDDVIAFFIRDLTASTSEYFKKLSGLLQIG